MERKYKFEELEELDDRELEQVAAGGDRFDQDFNETDFDWRKRRRGAGSGNTLVIK